MNFSAHEVFICQKSGIFQKFFKIFLAVDFDVCHSLQNVNVCGDVALCDATILIFATLVFIEVFTFLSRKCFADNLGKALWCKGFLDSAGDEE